MFSKSERRPVDSAYSQQVLSEPDGRSCLAPARLGGLYWLCLHHTRCVLARKNLFRKID